MKLNFECTCCGEEVEFNVSHSDSIVTEDVVCPHCENVYTVEVYFEDDGSLIGCHPFDYGWYAEHGDEPLTINL